jgi:Zn-dependent membrane protease YugP
MYVMAPVIFGASKTSTKTINEEYVIEKAEASKSIIKASAGTMAYLISGCWCYSDCTNIKWSICEEK